MNGRFLPAALVALALLPASPARGDESQGPEAAAAAVATAVESKDRTALEKLAKAADPDPWLVASRLCARGAHDAAEAFAAAGKRADTQTLGAYVAARRGRGSEDAVRKAVLAAEAALDRKAWNDALAALEAGSSADDPVLAVTADFVRGVALQEIHRNAESVPLLRRAAAAALELGWLRRAARAQNELGISSMRVSDVPGALAAWEERIRIAAIRGDERGRVSSLSNIALLKEATGDFRGAIAMQEDVVRGLEKLGDRSGLARAWANLGAFRIRVGEYAESAELLERALAVHEELGEEQDVADVLGNLGTLHTQLGDTARALAFQERSLALATKSGDELSAAQTLGNIGALQLMQGAFPAAEASLTRSLAMKEKLGDKPGAANTVVNLAEIRRRQGRYAEALSGYERGLALQRAASNRLGEAIALQNLGVAWDALGDPVRSVEHHRQALAIFEECGDRVGAARQLLNLSVQLSSTDLEEASRLAERAHEAFAAVGQREDAAAALWRIAEYQALKGDVDRARSALETALGQSDGGGFVLLSCRMRNALGRLRLASGDAERAKADFGTVRTAARELGALDEEVEALRGLAACEAIAGDAKRGIELSREAIERMGGLLRGLSDVAGAEARGRWVEVFEIGVCAATRAGDAAAALHFLESARAGALLESLRVRDALTNDALPKELAQEDLGARAAEAAANAAYRRALASRKVRAVADAEAQVKAAQARRTQVVERIQREAKAAASVLYPRPAALAQVQARLGPADALVLYGVFALDSVAVVVTKTAVRSVVLGDSKDLAAACTALDAGTPGSETAAAADALRRRAVEPLGLDPKKVQRVLVSPDGALSYVPFALLMPAQDVVYVPSGTTWTVLHEDRPPRGSKVLALGDPDYRGAAGGPVARLRGGVALAALPATRLEAQAVGTTVLLGADANESGLRAALAKEKRWAAVHLACHGLIDTERPMLSSLAVTASGDDDGLLTALDVFRMKVPADLTVLSACETARGRIARGEGVMGLTRAFMFAGAPRVVVSLWKVDDEATRALMTRFHELRAKGTPTAAALRQAQASVREQPRWKHPAYWAAWQLWGLGD